MDPEKKKAIEAIETGLGSIGRMRILKTLSSNLGEPLTKYAISKQTGLKHKDLIVNLRILVRIGWVEEFSTRPIKYKINVDNEIVSSLLDFFYRTHYI